MLKNFANAPLGVILVEQGQRIQGRIYLEQALTISRSQLGPTHPTTRQIEANLKLVKINHSQRHGR